MTTANGATLYLMCGKAGSGKTTLARKLEAEMPAIRFSKDEWIVALYGRDIKKEEWAGLERRCYDVIFNLTRQLLLRGLDVILDSGFWNKNEREEARILAESAGARAIVYYLNAPDEVRMERLLHRNTAPSPGSVEVLAHDFLKQLNWFEIPTAEEGMTIVEVSTEICGRIP